MNNFCSCVYLFAHSVSFAGAIAAARSWFGPGKGPIVLDDIECVGTEATLHLCPHGGIGNHDCSEAEHASVICQRKSRQVCLFTNIWYVNLLKKSTLHPVLP